ncbi:MAG: MerR family transcriptional regulator [Firmicutes bacterium]|nr:MerR family transcriptional regulator [Bacillota bacterium]
MSKYTTGELAKLCGVTVRTVQYYDTRGILVPSELTEGGRRLYSEDDVKRMKIICFLRELGLSLDSIGRLLSEEDPGSVISLLLDQQAAVLKKEVGQREEQLRKISELKRGLSDLSEFSVESIGDIAHLMSNRKRLRDLRLWLTATALPLGVLQWTSIILWITEGIWWLFLVWLIVTVPYVIRFSRWYFRKMAYICPQCHTVFQPSVREGFWARHTCATRRLTCPACGHHGFCVEIAAETADGTEVKRDA